ncbi:MAG: hypothetical protein ACNA8W_19630 [Bradymonadaceae bacterium]
MKENQVSISVKEQAQKLVDNLSEDSSWDDLMGQIYVLQAIENGLEDSAAGRIVDVEAVRARFGLDR